jgi:hypothetical protein
MANVNGWASRVSVARAAEILESCSRKFTGGLGFDVSLGELAALAQARLESEHREALLETLNLTISDLRELVRIRTGSETDEPTISLLAAKNDEIRYLKTLLEHRNTELHDLREMVGRVEKAAGL